MKINRNFLKWAGLLSMTVDHIGMVFFVPGTAPYVLFRAVGRLAAPAMCFLLAEGFLYTSSVKNYLRRLMLCAVLSQVPFCLVQGKTLREAGFNMLFTLSLSLAVLEVYAQAEPGMSGIRGRALSANKRDLLIFLLLALSAFCDWGVTAPLWTLGFYAFRGQKKRQALSYAAVCTLTIALDALSAGSQGLPVSRWGWQAGRAPPSTDSMVMRQTPSSK